MNKKSFNRMLAIGMLLSMSVFAENAQETAVLDEGTPSEENTAVKNVEVEGDSQETPAPEVTEETQEALTPERTPDATEQGETDAIMPENTTGAEETAKAEETKETAETTPETESGEQPENTVEPKTENLNDAATAIALDEDECTHPNATYEIIERINDEADFVEITAYTHTYPIEKFKKIHCPDCGEDEIYLGTERSAPFSHDWDVYIDDFGISHIFCVDCGYENLCKHVHSKLVPEEAGSDDIRYGGNNEYYA